MNGGEPSPKILASEEKATTNTTTRSENRLGVIVYYG